MLIGKRRALLEYLKRKDPERYHSLIDRLGIREEQLRRRSATASARASRTTPAPVLAERREDKTERLLLSMMLRLPAVTETVASDPELCQVFSEKWRPAVDGILTEWQKHGNIDLSRLMENLPAESGRNVAALALEGERFSDSECSKAAADCITRLKREIIRSQRRDKRLSMRVAGEKGDEQANREGMLAWHSLEQKERQLERPKLEPKPTLR